MEDSSSSKSETSFRQLSLEENTASSTSTSQLGRQKSRDGRVVIKEGWGEKESGQKLFGQYNWRRRWFQLTAKGQLILFSYYVKPTDTNARGEVLLTQEYTARELEMGEKSKPNCLALGPFLDSSALRTYYVSCDSEEDKIDWITTLNCAIEGVPEKATKRMSTFRMKSTRRAQGRRETYPPPEVNTKGDTFSYMKFSWRLKQWKYLCEIAQETKWRRCDTKQGITVARQSFKDTEMAVIKIESVVAVPKQMAYEYLKRSVQAGGKFDYILRGETLLQKIEEYCTVTEVTKNDYDVPLPGMKRRDACCARMWLPEFVTEDGSAGVLVMSVNHPKGRATKDLERIFADISGIVLRDEPSQDNQRHTRVTIIAQIDLQNALQNMLRGAYKSGMLKKGIRNGFGHFLKCLLAYKAMLSI
eukprot:gene9266-10244_t